MSSACQLNDPLVASFALGLSSFTHFKIIIASRHAQPLQESLDTGFRVTTLTRATSLHSVQVDDDLRRLYRQQWDD